MGCTPSRDERLDAEVQPGVRARDPRRDGRAFVESEGMTLNSLERVRSALSGGIADRVPVVPMIVSGTARWAGVTVARYAADPAVMADCLMSAQQRAGYDGIHVSLNVSVEAEALGR